MINKIIQLTLRVGYPKIVRIDIDIVKSTPLVFHTKSNEMIRKSEMYKVTDHRTCFRDSYNVFFTDEEDVDKYSRELLDFVLEVAWIKYDKAKNDLELLEKLKESL